MHLIQKHSINVDCEKQSLGNRIKDELSDVMSQNFYPKLETLLDEHDHLDMVQEIKRVPIEITITNSKNWKEELVSQSLQKIEEFLKAQMPKFIPQNSVQITPNSIIGVSQEKYVQNLFVRYLKTGALPVNTISEKISKIYEVLIIDDAFTEELTSILSGDYQAILRWSLNISKSLKEKIATIDSELYSSAFIKHIFAELVKKKKEEIVKNSLDYEGFLEFLFWVSSFSKKENRSSIEINTIRKIARRYYQIDDKVFEKIIHQLVPLKAVKKQFAFFDLVKRLQLQSNLTEDRSTSRETKSQDTIKRDNDILDTLLETANDMAEKKPVNSWYIHNTGLVILQPFLFELFQKLKFLEGNSWIDKQSQDRAVLITQYLMDSTDEIFESDLVLNKILCGVPVNDTVCTQWKIKPHEKKLCNQLLETVITHWAILKNTSIATLQESFLRRKGKLNIHKNGHYELTVEQKSIDLLLDQLPWGIGMIKTPWMDTYITCHWN